MALELVVVAPYKLEFREYKEPPLAENQIRVRSEFSSAKHGTERGFYRGTGALVHGSMNEDNIYIPDKAGKRIYPYLLGNMTVGTIIEVGLKVKRWREGDRVFFYGGFRETHTIPEEEAWPLYPGMAPESAVYLDPAKYAFGGINSAQVSLGYRVAVFGLGAIGQMAVQMAKLSGAMEIYGVDNYQLRRQAALKYGATEVIDPSGCDTGRLIKEKTGGVGVDVAIEASGAVAGLHHAIRGTMRGGKIVTVGLYEGGATDLRLAEDWHRNQQVMIASQGPNFPSHNHPYWAGPRFTETVIELLRRGWLKTEGLVLPVVPFLEADKAYQEVEEHPEETIKLGVRY